jgi:hypothetical protein
VWQSSSLQAGNLVCGVPGSLGGVVMLDGERILVQVSSPCLKARPRTLHRVWLREGCPRRIGSVAVDARSGDSEGLW